MCVLVRTDGAIVEVMVGVIVSSGVPSYATTVLSDPPARLQAERTIEELLATESQEIERGAPAALATVPVDHGVYGLPALLKTQNGSCGSENGAT